MGTFLTEIAPGCSRGSLGRLRAASSCVAAAVAPGLTGVAEQRRRTAAARGEAAAVALDLFLDSRKQVGSVVSVRPDDHPADPVGTMFDGSTAQPQWTGLGVRADASSGWPVAAPAS